MIRYLLPVILLFFNVHGKFISKTRPVPDTKIVGGSTAPDGGMPYQVSLRRMTNDHFCGGALLNHRYIITAAHCAVEFTPSTMSVVVGTNKLMFDGENYAVEELITHEGYDGKKIINDIALIKVTKDIEFNDKIQPIALPTKHSSPGANVLLSGWGRTKGEDEPIPDQLQMINQTVLSNKLCRQIYKHINVISDSEVCTITSGGRGSCQGDSGGPLVDNNELMGLVSWGMNCQLSYPDVNTRVMSYVDWIKSHMDSA